MSFFLPQNPGIGGIDELTLNEELVVQTIAALGTPGYFLRTNLAGTAVEWAAVTGGGALDDLSDVIITTPSSGQLLQFNGTNWVNATVSGSGDVTAASSFGTDNLLIKSDGTGKGVQATGITIADSTDAMSGMASITIDASGSLLFGAITILSDSTGTTTLQNIDAIDATTEATLEGALELDSLQGNLSVSHLNSGTGASASTFWRGDGTWATPGGSGDVSKVGTPVNNQVGVWTGDGTIEGDASLTFDTATDTLTVAGEVVTPEIQAASSAGLAIRSNSGSLVADFGAGGGQNATFENGTTIKGLLTVGSGAATGTIQSNGNYDLVLQTGNAATSNITIVDGANGDINFYLNTDASVNLYGGGTSNTLNLYESTFTANVTLLADAVDPKVEIITNSYSTTVGAGYLDIVDANAGANGAYIILHHNSASPAVNDIVGRILFNGEDNASNETTYAQVEALITDTTNTSEDGLLNFRVMTAGTLASELSLTGAALYPATNDGLTLGSTANQFSDLFLAEGGVINWDNGDATLTQSGNDVTLAGASLTARIKKRTGTTSSSATPTINTDEVDEYYITAQTVDITSFTTNLSGTPTEGQTLFIAITGTAARAITWGASFENGPVALPTTTVTTTRLDVLFKWNSVTSKWRCMASGSTA